MPPPLRLIIDPAHDGPTNMALDEVLLERLAAGTSPPTLRFYAWAPATISLGYFQDYAEFLAQPPPINQLAVVRRTTGGGAILHHLELTYSLALPIDDPRALPNATRLYELVHRAIIAAVGPPARLHGCGPVACSEPPDPASANTRAHSATAAQRGPFFCFARRHALDVVLPTPSRAARDSNIRDERDAPKLAGSAQRRTRRAVLQHGSVILDTEYPQQPCAAWSTIGGPRSFAAAAEHLRPHFEAALGTTLVRSAWSTDELTDLPNVREKYAGSNWTIAAIKAR